MKNLIPVHLVRYLFFIMSGLIFLPYVSTGQTSGGAATDNFKVNIVPPSPEASALAKNAEVPVSLYSGLPEISIALYELKERGLSVPITLSYNASSNKVDAIAPRTGLGWSLNTHGSISRAMRGWPDEFGTRGFLNQSQQRPLSAYATAPDDQRALWFTDMADGCMDLEPDQFYFNFGSYSGSFAFDWDGQIKMATGSSINITPTIQNDRITKFQAIGEDGTTFTFDVTEYTQILEFGEDGGTSIGCLTALKLAQIPQTWYLSKIESVNKESWISFSYSDYVIKTTDISSESRQHDPFNLGLISSHLSKTITSTFGKQLREINTSSSLTRIEFIDGQPRTDIHETNAPANNGGYELGQVRVRNWNGQVIKDWRFGYDNSTGRLTLKTLTEWAGTQSNPPYQFLYNGSIGAHSDRPYKQDHWGFLNNNTAQTLIPAIWARGAFSTAPVFLAGADREPSATGALQGLLKEIIYPTGGKDKLDFELNNYSYMNGSKLNEEQVQAQQLYEETPDTGTSGLDTDITEFNLPFGAFDLTINSTFTYGCTFAGSFYGPTVAIEKRNGTTWEQVYHASPGGVGTPDPDAPGGVIPEVKELTAILGTGNGSGRFETAPGLYRLKVTGRISPPNLGGQNDVQVMVNYDKRTNQFYTPVKQGGGARIARITRSYGLGNPDKVTKYIYSKNVNGEQISTGSLSEEHIGYESITNYEERSGSHNITVRRQRYTRSSQNRTMLGTTKGSLVGYSEVTVLQGENGEFGKTVNKFTSAVDFPDTRLLEIPYPPTESVDYSRGLLKEQASYDQANALLHLVQNEYSQNETTVPAIKMGWFSPGGFPGAGAMDLFARGDYANVMGYPRLSQTIETTFFPNDPLVAPHVVKKKFTYNETGHKQLSLIKAFESDGDSIVTQMIYPGDFSIDTGTPTIRTMRDRNMQSEVLETVVWKYAPNNQYKLLSAASTSFMFATNMVLPSYQLSAKIAAPIITSDPVAMARQLYEGRLKFSAYSMTSGNLLEHSLKDGMKTAYVWDVNEMIILAKADNAMARQIFFTSFEEDPAGTPLHSRTGRYSQNINGAFYIPTNKRPAVGGGYILSWWESATGTNWTYKEKLVQYTVGESISTDAVTGFIDDVRLYPKDARMTSYTIEPLVGVTSITDPNNATVYFEYDAFNRLIYKRDQDRNILERYDYQYQEDVNMAVQH